MTQNAQNVYTLRYPENSGFDETKIFFYKDSPDLNRFFFEENKTDARRLFVTDTTIASLPCMRTFTSSFKADAESHAGKTAEIFTRGKDALIILGAGEKFKTIESVLSIVRTALEGNFNRNCIFTGIGGGVVCDMTGFAASMFKRGVLAEFVPTTLLADVDASVGGKTGCDFESYKNMIGAFYPAKNIHIWSSFIQTLPQNEFISGLAEAIKTAFLFSAELTELFLSQKDSVMKREQDILDGIVEQCARAKAKIVSEDFREHGDRAFLNYGHTFGHALESVAGLGKVTHGEAVAWGMSRAVCVSLARGVCSKEFADKTLKTLALYGYETGAVHSALKNIPSEKTATLILNAMKKDKKNNSAKIRLTLQSGPQQTFVSEADDEEILSVLAEQE